MEVISHLENFKSQGTCTAYNKCCFDLIDSA